MKIECKIKRANGTVVDMPNEGAPDTRYHFKPVDARENSPHVAEVANDDHAQRFLAADPTVYRIYSAKPAPKLDPPAPPPPPATPATGENPDGTGGEGDGDGGEEATEVTIKDLRAGIASKSLTPERLRELLDHEQQREKPRNSFIAEIMAALK